MEYTEQNPLRLIELFAGIGSQTQALKNIGVPHKVVAVSEIDKYAIKSYEAMHGSTNNLGDIRHIKHLPDADLWTYSFPCQDISVAGRGAGIKEGTRSGLLFEVERLLKTAAQDGTLPKYLLLENVKNLVGKRFKADFDSWLSFLSGLGYSNYWKVLNAKDYGIPQNRERVFCVSIRGEHAPFFFPQKRELKLRLRDMLDAVVDERYYLKESTIRSILTSHFNSRRNSVKQEGDVANTILARDWKGPQCVKVGDVVGDKWERMHETSRRVFDPNGLSPTVHCAGGGNTELKIMVEGNYSPSEHNAARVVDPDGLAPTVMENHGTVTAITEKAAERFYKQAVETVLENDCEVGDTVDAFSRKINKSRLCPTITTRPEGFKTAILPIVKDESETVVVAGQFQPVDRDYKGKGKQREEHFECRNDEISNAVLTGDRKNCVCIAAMRGRNPDNPSDRSPGQHLEQRLELGEKDVSNTLTSVQKDNLVVESDFVARKYDEFIEQNGYIPEMFQPFNKQEIDDIAPTLTGRCSVSGGMSAVLKLEEPLQVKVATKQGYEEAERGDYVNITYPGSKTKRGRVGKGIAHTLTCGDGNAVVTENVRIRKLTPRECLRLMGWVDEQIDKIAAARVSSTQQYKQAGNGIVVQVLEAIFKALFFGEI